MTDGYETTLAKANVTGTSLRVAVPSGLVKHFGLKEGDKFHWNLEIKDNEFVIVVKPIRKEVK